MKPPACRTCSRKGWTWEGPTRVICPSCQGSGCRPAQPIPVEGERGAAKREARKDARAQYFDLHNKAPEHHALRQAQCQFCTILMTEKVDLVDAAHKLRRWKGNDEPENMAAVHRDCHDWQGQNREAEDFFAACPISVITGGMVLWPQHLKEDLERWKARHKF